MSDFLNRGEAHAKAWSGYWWPMRDDGQTINIFDDGGPLTKNDRYCVASGLQNPHSQDFERWQNWSDARMDAATGQTSSWWGHCNGWAAAAALEAEPTRPIKAGGIAFGIGDQKGLLTVCHNADPTDLIRGLGLTDAHIMHQLILQSIGKEQRVLIFDTKLDPKDPATGASIREVWNYPAYKYECSYQQHDAQSFDVTMKLWFATDGVAPDFVGIKNWPVDKQPKVYTYRITGDRESPVAGSFTGESANDHPDIVWRPQPLSVQNAAEEHNPGASQTRFHPVRRTVVYSLIAGQTHAPSDVDRDADRKLTLTWVTTPEEAAAYPPPVARGDWWRYSVTHLDSAERWSRPFRIHVEIVGWVGPGATGQDWVMEVGTIEQGEHMHVRHVVWIDGKTRMLSSRSKYGNGYAYSLHRDPKTGGFTRSEDPSLWDNSPLRLLMSQMPYAWERAGMEPVQSRKLLAFGDRGIASRMLKVGKGKQYWADHQATSEKGNLRGLFLEAALDRINAVLIDLGRTTD